MFQDNLRRMLDELGYRCQLHSAEFEDILTDALPLDPSILREALRSPTVMLDLFVFPCSCNIV